MLLPRNCTKCYRLLFLTMFLFTVACARISLYGDLTDEDANEMMVLLEENGISATKSKVERQNEFFYAIQVKPQDMAKARSLLVAHNLPRRKELGLSGVYKEKGLIPTPDEQKARYLLALKGEIINSLERLPEVVDADVVLNIPVEDEFRGKDEPQKRPTASVIVRATPSIGVKAGITEAKLQEFVANAVERLNPRDVSVIISYLFDNDAARPGDVRTLPLQENLPALSGEEKGPKQKMLGLSLDSASKSRLKAYLLVFFVLLVFLATALIIMIVQGGRMRRRLEELSGGGHPALEGQVMDERQQIEP
ncbi:MAG: hypothetical protein HY540_07760 [Deltaproteobacteria bacterium]|nr:hypothetical protein [Deltaproteobacteria bacterium]